MESNRITVRESNRVIISMLENIDVIDSVSLQLKNIGDLFQYVIDNIGLYKNNKGKKVIITVRDTIKRIGNDYKWDRANEYLIKLVKSLNLMIAKL